VAAGDLGQARTALEAARREVRSPAWQGACDLAAANLALAEGNLDEADRLARGAIVPGTATGRLARAYLILGKVAQARSDWAVARQCFDWSWQSGRGYPEALWRRAEVEAAAGEDNTPSLVELVARRPEAVWGRQAAEQLTSRNVPLPPGAPAWDGEEAVLADPDSPAARDYCRRLRGRIILGHLEGILRQLLEGAAVVFVAVAVVALGRSPLIQFSDLVGPAAVLGSVFVVALVWRVQYLVRGAPLRVFPI
jgi:hypothetical protein